MSEQMTFPETFDEFVEQYKVVDKEQVYTNGSILIPVFRVKQWLEHCESIMPTCKVGDTVWINDYQYGVIPCLVDKPYHYNYNGVIKRFFTEEDIGKTVFLKEEYAKIKNKEVPKYYDISI